jgi:Zn-dependent protease with chaperone function
MPRSDETIRARLDHLEREAREHPRRHQLRLLTLALIGYLYPLLWFIVSFGLVIGMLALAPFVLADAGAQTLVVYCFFLLAAIVLAARVPLTFWVTLPAPSGCALGTRQAPGLRALIDEVRQPTGGVPVHHILIDVRFNAAVVQIPRFGLAGRRTNYLIIGLPLLIALGPEQLRAVLAHEFGHLRAEHGRFNAWIYRVHQTWEAMAAPFAASNKLRWLVMGWFVQRYGSHFASTTLAIRRVHEYAADRTMTDAVPVNLAANALLAIGWIGYRLGKSFWPAVLWEAACDPLPPADIYGRLAEFLAAPPPADMLARWRSREQSSRTPITEEHPCLADRLEALGCRRMLDSYMHAGLDVAHSCLPLLGDSRPRISSVANATWKAVVIEGWRREHAAAKRAQEKRQKVPTSGPAGNGCDGEWEDLQVEIQQAHPQAAVGMLDEFLARRPDHALAHYMLGRLLLEQDDARASQHLETAMSRDSDFIAPGLAMLLEYYRELGRDEDADPIRRRLLEHAQVLTAARHERLTVSRRDRFEPHDLSDEQVHTLGRVLYRYPRIRAAWIVRKQVRHLTDKPGYVLALSCRPGDVEGRANRFLTEALSAQMPFACAVVVLTLSRTRLRSCILKTCPSPVFQTFD